MKVTTTKVSATIADDSVENVEEMLQVVEKVDSDNKNFESEKRNLAKAEMNETGKNNRKTMSMFEIIKNVITTALENSPLPH